jgi:hypothetical protein
MRSDPPPPADSGPDAPFVVDYSDWWTPPPPPPHSHFDWLVLLMALAAVIGLLVVALCIAALAGDGDLQGRQN